MCQNFSDKEFIDFPIKNQKIRNLHTHCQRLVRGVVPKT